VTAEGPQLRAYDLEVADLQLSAIGSRREVTLDRLSTRIAGARLTATGRAAIGGSVELRLSSEEIPLRGFALLPQRFPLKGRVKLDLTGSGTLDNPTVRGQVRLIRLRAGQMAIGTGSLGFALDGRQLTYTTTSLQNVGLEGSLSLTEGLPVQARLAIRGLDLGAMSAQLAGTPRGVIEGDVAGVAEVRGRLRDLTSLDGHLTLNRLLLRSSRVELQNTSALRWQLAQGVLRFEAVRLQGQGTDLTVRGTAHLPETRLDMIVVGSGPMAMVGARIPGVRFHHGVLEAQVRQDIDLASLLRQYRQRALELPSTAQESFRLDIRVSTQDPLRVESRLTKMRATLDLHVRGSLSRPVVLGRVDIEEGTADVGGTRFIAVSGNVDFLNPTRTEPFFDITADSRKNGYQIHVIATGTPQQFDLNLTSEPALAETDILALLTVGATGQAITAGVGTVVPQRLSSFLTGRIAAEVSRGVGGIVGIDRLDIEAVVGAAQRVGGPKITLGKDVSRDLSVTYLTIVGSIQEDLATVEYRLTDSISILGIRDERGDVGVDVKFSFRFE
jgi:autotransporter translocation and assembly factor TamB